jgi:hypothetical protein
LDVERGKNDEWLERSGLRGSGGFGAVFDELGFLG